MSYYVLLWLLYFSECLSYIVVVRTWKEEFQLHKRTQYAHLLEYYMQRFRLKVCNIGLLKMAHEKY